MKPFYLSHKFWVLVSSLVALAGAVISGEASVSEVINQAVVLILGYLGIYVADKKVNNRKPIDKEESGQ